MNGIEKITERIAAQNDTDIKALMNRAEAQAKAVYEGYVAAADDDYKATVKKGEKDARERVERLGSVAQLEARKLQLAAKQEMLEKAFELAYQKLLSLPEDRYAELLTRLAVGASTTGSEALIFSQTDRSRYGKRVVIAANEQLGKEGRPGQSDPLRGVPGLSGRPLCAGRQCGNQLHLPCPDPSPAAEYRQGRGCRAL